MLLAQRQLLELKDNLCPTNVVSLILDILANYSASSFHYYKGDSVVSTMFIYIQQCTDYNLYIIHLILKVMSCNLYHSFLSKAASYHLHMNIGFLCPLLASFYFHSLHPITLQINVFTSCFNTYVFIVKIIFLERLFTVKVVKAGFL